MLALALIAATAAAFAWTESLKLERLPVVGPRFPESFSPVCVCPTETAKLRLRFRVNDTVDADILDADGEAVRSLGERRVRPGLVTFEWDGRNDEGRIVPDGPYRLKVEFEDKRRTIVIPNRIFVDTVPPEVVDMRSAIPSRSPLTVTAVPTSSGSRIGQTGPAGPLLYVGDQLAVEKPPRRARSAVIWDGTVDGELLPPGSYRLTLRVRDPAGNLSPESERDTVELRYITLVRGSVSRSAGRLRSRSGSTPTLRSGAGASSGCAAGSSARWFSATRVSPRTRSSGSAEESCPQAGTSCRPISPVRTPPICPGSTPRSSSSRAAS